MQDQLKRLKADIDELVHKLGADAAELMERITKLQADVDELVQRVNQDAQPSL